MSRVQSRVDFTTHETLPIYSVGAGLHRDRAGADSGYDQRQQWKTDGYGEVGELPAEQA